jgi:hypothetical protein
VNKLTDVNKYTEVRTHTDVKCVRTFSGSVPGQDRRLVATWYNVLSINSAATNSFSIALYLQTGMVHFSYGLVKGFTTGECFKMFQDVSKMFQKYFKNVSKIFQKCI